MIYHRMLQTALFLICILISTSTEEEVCVVRMNGGKMTNYGNCQPHSTMVGDGIRTKAHEQRAMEVIGRASDPGRSCKDIRRRNVYAKDGVFFLQQPDGRPYMTYCDMTTAGGGWTLVASIHENNITGKCTKGDRWSSEKGSSMTHPNGDGFWENIATYGRAATATRRDYKNYGYFSLNASDIMIWHVPNDAPIARFASDALFKYHTETGFLSRYGGNLATLYRDHYPMRSHTYSPKSDMGPAIPITWDVGSNGEYLKLLGPKMRKEVDGGFVQTCTHTSEECIREFKFRALNHEQNAYALCSGVKIKQGKANVEHACVGSTSSNVSDNAQYCGDFAGFSLGNGWRANETLINAVIMIFYK